MGTKVFLDQNLYLTLFCLDFELIMKNIFSIRNSFNLRSKTDQKILPYYRQTIINLLF